jgi:hypothetical protein
MPLLEEHRVSIPAVVDETAARRELRRQIADLERQLGDALVTAFPHTTVDVQVPGRSGPRVLQLGDLEVQRDALGAKLREVRAALEERSRRIEGNRVLLERMLLEPKRYKFVRLYRADIDMGGCGAYEVRPRLGLIGMMMGWWHVKLSSGCPLATSHGTS